MEALCASKQISKQIRNKPHFCTGPRNRKPLVVRRPLWLGVIQTCGSSRPPSVSLGPVWGLKTPSMKQGLGCRLDASGELSAEEGNWKRMFVWFPTVPTFPFRENQAIV